MNTVYETSFVVFPQDTNYMYPMVFGGKVMSEMDVAAAVCVRRALIDSEAKYAVTTRASNIEFHVGAVVGDLVFLTARIVKVGTTSINIDVEGVRELKDGARQKICNGSFTFVTVEDPAQVTEHRKLTLKPHGLHLPV